MANCPHCKSEVQPGWKACPACGERLPEMPICNSCGAELQQDWVACPQCGERLPEMPICNSCGTELQQDWIACPECGTRVKSNQKLTPNPTDKQPAVSMGDLGKFEPLIHTMEKIVEKKEQQIGNTPDDSKISEAPHKQPWWNPSDPSKGVLQIAECSKADVIVYVDGGSQNKGLTSVEDDLILTKDELLWIQREGIFRVKNLRHAVLRTAIRGVARKKGIIADEVIFDTGGTLPSEPFVYVRFYRSAMDSLLKLLGFPDA